MAVSNQDWPTIIFYMTPIQNKTSSASVHVTTFSTLIIHLFCNIGEAKVSK